MSLDWSPKQQRCLDALGFTLYRVVSLSSVAAAPSGAGDRFARALLRAAGQDRSAIADVATWFRDHDLPAPASVRGNPAAKRALWPRLRALRRTGPQH